jgi:diguanylate cyclase (GGDEF)-like protein
MKKLCNWPETLYYIWILKNLLSHWLTLITLYTDFGSALQFYIKYSEAAKANSDNRFIQQQAYHTVRAEIEVKNQRIAMLDKDNEVLSLQKDLYEHEAKQNRLVVLILAFVLVIATTLAYRGMAGRKRFKKIAEYDQLTGISNRYHFNNQARIALDYCENNAKPAAVILFDLDYFKTINDMHGHATGDWALQQVVKTCRNFMRNNDVFGRIGGEEFAVVLPGCHTDKAVLLAEICRDAIAAIDSSDSGKQFPLSASFGVSGSDTSGYQLKQLLADADHAMYQAKESGRDKVAAFSDYRSTV